MAGNTEDLILEYFQRFHAGQDRAERRLESVLMTNEIMDLIVMSHNGTQQTGLNPAKSGHTAPADAIRQNDVNGLAILVFRDSKLST